MMARCEGCDGVMRKVWGNAIVRAEHVKNSRSGRRAPGYCCPPPPCQHHTDLEPHADTFLDAIQNQTHPATCNTTSYLISTLFHVPVPLSSHNIQATPPTNTPDHLPATHQPHPPLVLIHQWLKQQVAQQPSGQHVQVRDYDTRAGGGKKG